MDGLVAFSRRRRRWLLLAALGTASAYGAYKIYHLPAVAARRRRLVRLAAALAAFLDAAASSADAAALVSSDLADFVRSDSDELPRSVAQLAKLAASPEVSATVSALSQAGHKAISSWVEVLVGTAVGVFIDKTIHINTYEQLFEGLTNPTHDAKVKELLVSVCNGAVETLVKTSHQVISKANSKLDNNGDGKSNSSGSGASRAAEGWVETVSSTLAVPSNRNFVLDVTGRVTFETVRSFLEFVLWKLHDGARKSGDTVCDSGLRAVRYMSDKSMVVATICITLCLHVLNGTRFLVTA
uniref:Protein PHLOEM PROTEIN 2-LIKE A10 n=1 Tax=Aegilops tauschii subsp. strangulata TaxID=200361 RepID=A0A453LWU6_AEGTS